MTRPRVRSRAGQEEVLPAVAAWRERDPLTARVIEQILLSTRFRRIKGHGELDILPQALQKTAPSEVAA